jgi:hypothetical protein
MGMALPEVTIWARSPWRPSAAWYRYNPWMIACSSSPSGMGGCTNGSL